MGRKRNESDVKRVDDDERERWSVLKCTDDIGM
jgi:hypothetical protein